MTGTDMPASATSSYGWTNSSSMSKPFTIETVPNPPTEPTTFVTMTSSSSLSPTAPEPEPAPVTSNVIDSGQGPLDHHHPHGTQVAPPDPENTFDDKLAEWNTADGRYSDIADSDLGVLV
ncbi:hypothetical protein GE09DRAFT_1220570 [Coniochaeta sp. 2T2.1]|nr:hypothetical protein GE09DRAFT_1220570 [Coniochaeta sp. 2T2.1]